MGDITWVSSDPTIFSIIPDGTDIYKAKIESLNKTGFATVTAYVTGNPSVRSSAGVSITPGITGISLGKAYIDGKTGDSVTLNVTYNPENPPNKTIIWSDISGLNHLTIEPSSDTTSAVIGLHTAGSGIVQAMTQDGGLIALRQVIPLVIQPMPFDNQFDHPFNLLGTSDGIYLLEDNTWRNASKGAYRDWLYSFL